MKGVRSTLWGGLIGGVVGIIITNIAYQWTFFEVEKSLNIIDLGTLLTTIFIGSYLAIEIPRKSSQRQALYHYVEPRFDELWNSIWTLEDQLFGKSEIGLNAINSSIKGIDLSLLKFRRVISSHVKHNNLLVKIENAVEQLETHLTDKAPIQDNQVNFDPEQVKKHFQEIHADMASMLKLLNRTL